MSWCRIELFGGFGVRVNGKLITRFRTRKTASLLAYLAYHLNRLHPREMLVEMFWRDNKPKQGRNSLSKAVSSLSHQLSLPVDSGSILYADRFYVGLRAEFVSTDVADFDAHLKMARSSRSVQERIFHLAEAVKVYRGELLPEFYDNWIELERLKRSEQFESAIQELVNFYERTGNLMQALHYARLALTVDPFSEFACERIMRLLLAIHQPAEALREFQAFSQRLKEQLGHEVAIISTRLRSLVDQANQQLSQLPQRDEIFSVSPKGLWIRSNFPQHPETINLLSVFWQHCNNGQNPSKTLRDLVGRHSGQIIKVEDNALFSVFPSARLALECAVMCRNRLRECNARCFVDTVDLSDEEDLTRALKQARELLSKFVKDGQVICSETTAALLKRNGCFPANLQKAKSLNALKSVKLFVVNSFNPPNKEGKSNLPPLITRFFGRSQELEQLRQWVLKERAPLVTLVGLGGSGKTRLALEFGHKVTNDFQGNVFFVSLQGAKEATILGEALTKALGLQISSEKEPSETAIQVLLGRRCLLIWDGFEQVLPEGLEILHDVMNRLPMAQNLVTSRCPLNLPQERVLPVMPLPFPQNSTCDGEEVELDLDAISQFPSVQMFVDRARAICPDFSLTGRTASKIAEICFRLEGLPLAIELTVSWLANLSLSQISERLKHRLKFLQTQRRNVPQRHKSIKAVLAMTWELLPEDLKYALACLSVFRSGATIDALQAVAGMKNINEAVSQLQGWGLVFPVGQQIFEQRFTLLDIVREFVLETLDRKVLNDLHHRHSKFFALLAEKFAKSEGRGGKRWSEWLRRMEAERENLRAALEWTVGNEPQTALQLMRSLKAFWSIQGTFDEAYRWSQRILDRISPEEVDLRTKALVLTGYWAIKVGDCERARKLCESALALYEQSSDELGQAEAHLLLAEIAFLRGDYRTANRHTRLSLDKYRAKGELEGEARISFTLGLIAFRQGDLQSSKRHYEQSLKLWKSLDDRMQVETVRVGLASVAWRQGNFVKAYELYGKALKFWSVVSPMKAAGILADWGLIALSVGDYERAQKHYETALEIRRKNGDQLGVGAALNGLASVAWRKGNFDEAQKLFSEALSIFQTIGNRWCIALTLTDLGNLALLRGKNKLARSLLSQSLQIWRELGDRWGIANALRKLAVSETRCGNFKEALNYLQESLQICQDLRDKLGIVETMEALAEIFHEMGNCALSVRFLSAAENLRRRLGAPLPEVRRERLTILQNELRDRLGQSRFETEWCGRKINLRCLFSHIKLKTPT